MLRDIDRMIPDSLERASNEDKIQVSRHKFSVLGSPRNLGGARVIEWTFAWRFII